MGKRILLISSDFFNYYRLIQEEMERHGWQVDYLSDRPSSSAFMKIAIRKLRFLVEPYLTFYYLNKLQKMNVQIPYDKVVIVKGEGLTKKVLTEIRKKYCSGKIYLYFWDGIKNIPGGKQNCRLVDKVFTFDSKDADSFGFTLLPLFFVRRNAAEKVVVPQWDLSFVGSIHGDRLKVLSKIRNSVSSWAKIRIFIYFGSPLLFYFRKFFDRFFRDFSSSELSLVSMPKQDAEDIFLRSTAVLDVNHQGQTGLTMRTMEALSLGKKLITTNQYIKKYPFYDENQILIIDRHHPIIQSSFLKLPPPPNFQEKLAPYEISAWVRTLLEASDEPHPL